MAPLGLLVRQELDAAALIRAGLPRSGRGCGSWLVGTVQAEIGSTCTVRSQEGFQNDAMIAGIQNALVLAPRRTVPGSLCISGEGRAVDIISSANISSHDWVIRDCRSFKNGLFAAILEDANSFESVTCAVCVRDLQSALLAGGNSELPARVGQLAWFNKVEGCPGVGSQVGVNK